MMLWDDNEEEYIDYYDWSNDPRSAPIGEEDENGEEAGPYLFLLFKYIFILNRKPNCYS